MSNRMSAEEAIQKMMDHVSSKHEGIAKEAKDLPQGLSYLAPANKLVGQAVAYKEMFEYLKLLKSVL